MAAAKLESASMRSAEAPLRAPWSKGAEVPRTKAWEGQARRALAEERAAYVVQ